MPDLEFKICPENHYVRYSKWNYAKDFSEKLRDADGRIMFENGLFCLECNRAYGLSKLHDKIETEEQGK